MKQASSAEPIIKTGAGKVVGIPKDMTFVTCSHCGSRVPDVAKVCPVCGEEMLADNR